MLSGQTPPEEGSGERADAVDTPYLHEERRAAIARQATNLLRHRYFILGVAAVVALANYSYTRWGKKPEYSSASRFAARGAVGSMIAAGLPLQLGISVGGGNQSGESLEFYTMLVRSPTFLREALAEPLNVQKPGGGKVVSGSLARLQGLPPAKPDEELSASVSLLLDRRLTAVADRPTSTVVLTTTAKTPELAIAVNRRLVNRLNFYNLERRQSQAKAERQFVEARMREAHANLLAAEEAQKGFVMRNRAYLESPQLEVEYNRLQRRVAFTQALYTSLAQSYEQARVDEVRNTPIISVVERPEHRVDETGTGRPGRAAFMGAIVAAFIASMLVILREHFKEQSRQYPEDYGRLWATSRAAAADLSPARLVTLLRRSPTNGGHVLAGTHQLESVEDAEARDDDGLGRG